MLRFIELIARFKEYVILCVLIIMSITMMSFGAATKLTGFRTIIIGALGIVHSGVDNLPNFLTITSENRALRELAYNLNQEVLASRKAQVENQILHELLHLKDSSSYPLVSTKIVGRTMDKSRHYVVIDAGQQDSVADNMAVVNYQGLVGYIFSASPHYSIVQTILDKNSRIAARVRRTNVNGILSWEGGDILWLKNIPKTDTVVVGDLIVTSPFSTRFPSDIPVGKIAEIRDEPNTLFSKIVVEPVVRFNSLEYVMVRRQQPDVERQMIEDFLEKKLQKK